MKQEILYTCFKICIVSKRKELLEQNLTKKEAERLIMSYKNSMRSIIVMDEQNN